MSTLAPGAEKAHPRGRNCDPPEKRPRTAPRPRCALRARCSGVDAAPHKPHWRRWTTPRRGEPRKLSTAAHPRRSAFVHSVRTIRIVMCAPNLSCARGARACARASQSHHATTRTAPSMLSEGENSPRPPCDPPETRLRAALHRPHAAHRVLGSVCARDAERRRARVHRRLVSL